jgi:hypothetical protein
VLIFNSKAVVERRGFRPKIFDESVEDVGYEYFNDRVLPSCSDEPVVRYLVPFISYVRLGEALVLDRQDSLVVYESDRDVPCTETGLFWLVTPKSL